MRGNSPQGQLDLLEFWPHPKACFETFKQNERDLCGEWGVFYHAYSFSALVYELCGAMANVLFGFSAEAPLPRLLMGSFLDTPDAPSLIARFGQEFSGGIQD